MGDGILLNIFLFQNKTVQCAIFIVPIPLCHTVFPGTQLLFGRFFDSGNISLLLESGVPPFWLIEEGGAGCTEVFRTH